MTFFGCPKVMSGGYPQNWGLSMGNTHRTIGHLQMMQMSPKSCEEDPVDVAWETFLQLMSDIKESSRHKMSQATLQVICFVI